MVPSPVEAGDAESVEARRLLETRIVLFGENGIPRLLSLLEISLELNFAYTTQLSFMSENDLRIMPVTWGLPQFVEETSEAISPTAFDLGIVKQLEGGELSPDIQLRWISAELGYGVFSSQKIPACTFLGEYVGIVLCTQAPGAYSLNFPCLDGGHEINAKDTGNLMRFINHSARPNASFQHVFHENIIHTVVRTVVDIFPDVQICVDYSPGYWLGRGFKPLDNN